MFIFIYIVEPAVASLTIGNIISPTAKSGVLIVVSFIATNLLLLDNPVTATSSITIGTTAEAEL